MSRLVHSLMVREWLLRAGTILLPVSFVTRRGQEELRAKVLAELTALIASLLQWLCIVHELENSSSLVIFQRCH